MPTSQIMVKRLGALRPTDNEGTEAMQRIPDGSLVKVSWTRPRNYKFHCKFFAMMGIIFKNQEHYKSQKALLHVCKIRTGHVEVIQTPHGLEHRPLSISFANMEETEFSQFYDRAVDWMLSEVIPGLQRQHLDTEVEAELVEFAA